MKTEIELQEIRIIALIDKLNMLYNQENTENKYTFEVVLLEDSASVDAIDLDLDHYRIDTFPGLPKITLPKVESLLTNIINEFIYFNTKLNHITKQEEAVKEEIKQTEEAVLEIADAQKAKGFEINEEFLSDFSKMWKEATSDIFEKKPEQGSDQQSLFESLVNMLEEIEKINFSQEEVLLPPEKTIEYPTQLIKSYDPTEYNSDKSLSYIQITTPHEQPVIEQELEILKPLMTFEEWKEEGKRILVEKGNILMKEADKIKDLYLLLTTIND